MNLSPTQFLSRLADSHTGGMSWLSALAGILLFALFNLLLTLLLPGKFAHTAHTAITLNAVAAFAAIAITPFVLRSVDKMQQQVTRQNSELRSLHAIDRAISGTLDLPTLLNVAIKEITLAVDGEFGALWLLAEDGTWDKTISQAFYNLTPGMQIALTQQLTVGVPDLARRTGVTQRRQSLEDTWKADRAAAALKIRNMIVVPITEGETVLGLIQVGNRGGALSPLSGFTEDDEKLLGDLAATVSVAVQHARLYQMTLRRDEILRGLVARTGDAIAASSDAANLMQILADEAARILSCRRVAVYEYNAGTHEFLPLAAHDDQSPTLESFQSQPILRAMEDLPATLSGHPRGSELPVPYVQNAPTALGLDISEATFLNSPGYVFILRSRDRRGIGLLCLLDTAPRLRQPDTAAFARALAAQASVTLENARLFAALNEAYAREKNISITLQESLMPEVSGRIGHFEFAHKYQSALEEAIIGGDFYDVFDLGEHRTGFVMADVSGKGLKAAVQTAMLKYTLRGFALETPDDPGRVLARVNEVVCSPLSSHDGFVTLFYGVVNTQTGDLIYANAGHEQPLLREAASRTVRPLPLCDGIALGALGGISYDSCREGLAPGDLLLLYTDGLTEARAAGGDFLGLEGLTALMPPGPVTAAECVRRVYARVTEFAGDVRRDDVAMLALRRLPG